MACIAVAPPLHVRCLVADDACLHARCLRMCARRAAAMPSAAGAAPPDGWQPRQHQQRLGQRGSRGSSARTAWLGWGRWRWTAVAGAAARPGGGRVGRRPADEPQHRQRLAQPADHQQERRSRLAGGGHGGLGAPATHPHARQPGRQPWRQHEPGCGWHADVEPRGLAPPACRLTLRVASGMTYRRDESDGAGCCFCIAPLSWEHCPPAVSCSCLHPGQQHQEQLAATARQQQRSWQQQRSASGVQALRVTYIELGLRWSQQPR